MSRSVSEESTEGLAPYTGDHVLGAAQATAVALAGAPTAGVGASAGNVSAAPTAGGIRLCPTWPHLVA